MSFDEIQKRIKSYLFKLLCILILTPFLKYLLYEPTKNYIDVIRHLKTRPKDIVMHYLSYSGDAETWVVLTLLVWAWDLKDNNYFINLFWFNLTYMFIILYITKSLFHAGRPYLDNIELGDSTINENVSAEFGCPSGHSIIVWSTVFNLLRWYTEIREAGYYL